MDNQKREDSIKEVDQEMFIRLDENNRWTHRDVYTTNVKSNTGINQIGGRQK